MLKDYLPTIVFIATIIQAIAIFYHIFIGKKKNTPERTKRNEILLLIYMTFVTILHVVELFI